MEAVMIQHSVIIPVDRSRVWQAITDPKRFSAWFGGHIEFARLAVGEPMTFFEENHGTIAAVEPAERFAYHWPAAPHQDVQTLVTFVLEPTVDGTLITVTEEGFEALPDDLRQSRLDFNNAGWGIQMDNIANYFEAENG